MSSSYELCRTGIELGGFELAAKLRELTSVMMVGQIDPFQYDELAALAREHANAETGPTDTNVLGALRTINAELAEIRRRLAALEEAGEEETIEYEYPEWERWDGQADSGYKFGDRVTHLGIRYVSSYVGLNVWEPGLLGTEALWTAVG